MKKLLTLTATLLTLATPAFAAAPVINQPAPDFTAKDVDGKDFKLSDQKGKIVVLEWTNNECPYVQKHYGSGNMQKTQKAAIGNDVVWVGIISSAPGRQGHVSAADAKKIAAEADASYTAEIIDESGVIGKMYDARTTPHMFVIDTEGKLAYMGAIDSDPSPRPESIETAKNYVAAAIDDLKAGRAVETATTQSYGCAVKYAD